jgi:hypothetical protein
MTTLVIEKLSENQSVKRLRIPAFIVHAALRFLPSSALSQLREKGIDLVAICSASRSGQAYSSSFELQEKKEAKTITLYLQH